MEQHSQHFARRFQSQNARVNHLQRFGFWVVVLGLLTGCNAMSAPALSGYVGGIVTYQGQPVTSGQLTLYPENSEPLEAEIRPDGSYAIEGASAGVYRVSIANDSLPEKYADPNTSGLIVEIDSHAGPVSADFELR